MATFELLAISMLCKSRKLCILIKDLSLALGSLVGILFHVSPIATQFTFELHCSIQFPYIQ